MTNSKLLSKVKAEAPVSGNFKKYYKGQCQAITKEGTQCTREAVGSKYCWQHQVEENQCNKKLVG